MLLLLTLTLACTGNEAPADLTATLSEVKPEVSAVSEAVPAVVAEPVPAVPVAQVRIEQVRTSYTTHLAALKTYHAMALNQNDKIGAATLATFTTILEERFSPGELSFPDTEGVMQELQHDLHDEGRWTFTLFDPSASSLGLVIGMWAPDEAILYFNGDLTSSMFATSQLCHELKHVEQDIPILDGKAKRQPEGRREREADAAAYQVLNVATEGRYGALITAAAKEAEVPADGSFYVDYIPQEIYGLVGVRGDYSRAGAYQQAIIDINVAIVTRTTKAGPTREAKLDGLRESLAMALQDPAKLTTFSWASDE